MRLTKRKLYIKVFTFACLILFLFNLYLLNFKNAFYLTNLLFKSYITSQDPVGNEQNYTGFLPKISVEKGSDQELNIAADVAMQKPKLRTYEVNEFIREDPSMLSKYGFNVELSKNLFYIRHLPDFRPKQCVKELQKSSANKLPTASVVIVFHNVPYSLLLRTLHSILSRSNSKALQEVILVDDFSTNRELGYKLEYYIQTRLAPKVQLKRTQARLGKEKARLLGLNGTSSDVLIFMDVHSEPNVGWLEPLLSRIKESPSSVVLPIQDLIDPIYLEYRESALHVGGFSWNGNYYEEPISERESNRRQRVCSQEQLTTCVIQTPLIPLQATYAISRPHFDSFAFLDPNLVTSGGESLEMSFAIWMCGGQIELAPCSRVGRIQMDSSYTDPFKNNTNEEDELGRIATSWWDDKAYYLFYFRSVMQQDKFDDESKHYQNIRHFLNCKSFDWYLHNVYPEKLLPTNHVIKYGLLRQMINSICLRDQLLNNDQPVISLTLVYCDEITQVSDYFFYTTERTLQSEFNCLIVDINGVSPTYMVDLMPCAGVNKSLHFYKWKLKGNKFKLLNTTLCLDIINMGFKQNYPVVRECQQEAETQKWIFAKFKKKINSYSSSSLSTSSSSQQTTKITKATTKLTTKFTTKAIDKKMNKLVAKPKPKPQPVVISKVKLIKKVIKAMKPAKQKEVKKPAKQTAIASKNITKSKSITTLDQQNKGKTSVKATKSTKNEKILPVHPKK